MVNEKTTGGQLRSLREAAGMSQADLAQALSDGGLEGFYPQTIVKIEQGRRSLKFEEGVAIAAIFGVEAEAMIVGATWSEEAIEARRRARSLQEAHSRAHEALLALSKLEKDMRELLDSFVPGDLGPTEQWLHTALCIYGLENTLVAFQRPVVA